MSLVVAETRGAVGLARLNRPTRSGPASARAMRLFELAMAAEDRVESMNAFLEKRKPEFRGR